MGIYFTWYYVGMTALPLVAGLVRDITGDPAGIFLFGGAIMAVCAALLIVFRFENRILTVFRLLEEAK